MNSNVNLNFKIISLVRDPISREISALFHNLKIHFPDFNEEIINYETIENKILNWS